MGCGNMVIGAGPGRSSCQTFHRESDDPLLGHEVNLIGSGVVVHKSGLA